MRKAAYEGFCCLPSVGEISFCPPPPSPLQAKCDCTDDCSCKCSKCSKFKEEQVDGEAILSVMFMW